MYVKKSSDIAAHKHFEDESKSSPLKFMAILQLHVRYALMIAGAADSLRTDYYKVQGRPAVCVGPQVLLPDASPPGLNAATCLNRIQQCIRQSLVREFFLNPTETDLYVITLLSRITHKN